LKKFLNRDDEVEAKRSFVEPGAWTLDSKAFASVRSPLARHSPELRATNRRSVR
jgi:hypothetical protein